ncbi:UDP-N-acetylmuramate dehydrogenase [Streptomyces sp. NBC_00424]|uniref:UDP-N-acetylmuramate dehydrogenase n=1 Tax=Streptomyces sp. NBC_00424 TaxID=2903648 RepID=UPI0022505E73|nr:UDP-N-acetylmuramate dehydrogenase [Streptomyces sp. NBC_00424]MCX5078923.1 UDP-N-acetylmuramate dehydrogenase [Streptomyces sp. NBC_00424]
MGQHLLSDHTTLRLGGPAPLWLTHTDPADWETIVRTTGEHGALPFTLGGGSNTLADEHGTHRPVIHMNTRGIQTRTAAGGQVEVSVQAGHALADLVAHTVAEGLSGIEYLGGIPGTAGAAPVQNAGAYGQEIGDTLTVVFAHDWTTGRTVRLNAKECGFGYRTSIFKQHPGRWTILNLTLRLNRSPAAAPVRYQHLATTLDVPLGTRPALDEGAAAVLHDRQIRGLLLPESGPDRRQAGSCFLNPTITTTQADSLRRLKGPLHTTPTDSRLRASAGWLLEHCGFQPGGEVAPGVRCSSRRTLTLTAQVGATCATFGQALATMTARVREATGITLNPEPALVTPPPRRGR